MPQSGQRWIEVAPTGSPTTITFIGAHEILLAGGETGIRLPVDDVDVDTNNSHLLEISVAADQVLRWEGIPPSLPFATKSWQALRDIEISDETDEFAFRRKSKRVDSRPFGGSKHELSQVCPD